MKRIIYTFALVAVAMILLPSCESAEGEMDGYVAHGDGVTLYVSDPTSRTSFTDEGTEGLSIVWEEGDTFALYDSDGARVDNFVCTTIENGAFSSVDDMTTLTEGAAYTAIYPASTEATLAAAKEAIIFAEQRGVEIDDMDDNCYMLMSFTYSAEVDIEDMVFEHQMAIMTIKFTTANITKIVFANGTDKYTINCEGIVAESGVYTSYAMIAPCEATSRELNFKLYTSGATEPVAIRTTTSTKAYVAGTRYTAELYNYSAPTLFSGGDGTEANPYQISTASDFNTLSTNVAADTTYEGEYFILTNDVDLGDENFTPVGQTAHYFKGIFDGGGNSVDIFISNTDTTYQALFGYINSATIKNIDVTGSISGYKSCAGIVGYAYNSSIINCRNYATIDSVSSRAGGIVGGLYISDNVESITISGCENYATITGDDCYVGGVIGYCNAASSSSTAPVVIISDCANYGSVVSSGTDVFWSSDPDKYIGLGGIVGYGTARIEISNCTNSGAVSMDGEYDATGGIIGYGSRVAITNCYNKSTVDGYRYVGGIAGYLTTTSSIINCKNISKLTIGYGYCGGIVGYIRVGEVANCFNRGTIDGNGWNGGIVGYAVTTYYTSNFTLYNCYSSATLTGDEYGILGYATNDADDDNLVIDCCYYNKEVVESGDGYGGYAQYDAIFNDGITGYTTAAMTASSFVSTLNTNVTNGDNELYCDWKTGADGYPDFDI